MNIRTLLFLFLAFSIAQNSFAKEKNESAIATELEKLYSEDQADRNVVGMNTDWEAISIRDEQRENRVKELLSIGSLGGGSEYYHAAMILQHATTPDDYLLAHDLCLIAVSKGEQKAKWLAAASMDRFLISIGRQQRFGTQFLSNKSFRPPHLVQVDANVSDVLRKELDVPTLANAKKQEAEMEREFNERRSNQIKK
ncbi:MAG: hypothetical protein EOO07_22380 [Chitinophagaceae bacterium]|nr:MAG: hypothetical protein EOO07_22380 [Chitinophagaceae bacterium]